MQRFRGETELGVFLSTPFEGSGGHMGIGWRFALGIGWDRIPLTVGIDGQGAYFGSSSSRGVVVIGSEELEIDKSRTDSALFLSLYARIQPPYWPVRPYVEGLAGPKRLRTDYTVEFVGGTGSAEVTTDDHWTYTLGVGAGVDLPLGSRLWLTGGVRYLAGGVASYSRAVAGDSDSVIRYRTSTTIKTFSLGLAGRFGGSTEGG
jgi:opacity protein-like surface antigen